MKESATMKPWMQSVIATEARPPTHSKTRMKEKMITTAHGLPGSMPKRLLKEVQSDTICAKT
jgi:hypothetical protein